MSCLARWAKRLSWQEVARVFRTSWDQVFRSVAMAVAWGRDHVDLTGIRAIGIDEIHWQHGGNFLTLVYQIAPMRKRLLWIGQHRRAKTLLRFFRWFGKERTAALTFICSDRWKLYLQVVAKKGDHALHILDRFHIAKHMSDAIDRVRRAEVRSLRPRGRQLRSASVWARCSVGCSLLVPRSFSDCAMACRNSPARACVMRYWRSFLIIFPFPLVSPAHRSSSGSRPGRRTEQEVDNGETVRRRRHGRAETCDVRADTGETSLR